MKQIKSIFSFEKYQRLLRNKPRESPKPFRVYTFGNKNIRKRLFYFPVKHTYDPMHSAFKNDGLRSEIQNADPHLVIVEGLRGVLSRKTSSGKRRAFISSLLNQKEKETIKAYGEMGFAVRLAAENEIEVISAEPGVRKEVQYLSECGFSEEGIFVYYAFRQIANFLFLQEQSQVNELFPKIKKKEESKKDALEKFISPTIELIRKETKNIPRWKLFDFSMNHALGIGASIWARDSLRQNSAFLFKSLDPTVYGEKDTRRRELHEVARRANYFRDHYIIEEIICELKKFDRVFVVYGIFHFIMQKDVFDKLFKNYFATR